MYRGLQGNPCNENRDPVLRTGVPSNENRFFPVGIDSQGDSCEQSHYREVAWWEIFMEQELRFGLDLGRFGNF